MDKNGYQLTVFVGDTGEYLANRALEISPGALLIDNANALELMHRPLQDHTTYYTSVGDFSGDLKLMYDLLCCADILQYHPPMIWSDGKKVDVTNPLASLQGLTESMINLACQGDKNPIVETDHLDDPDPVVCGRQSNQPQLWIAGCSISHGVGVASHQKYGFLLSQALSCACSYLTRPGASIDWAAGQILRADVAPGDILVWGITDWSRLTVIDKQRLVPGVTALTFKTFPGYRSVINENELVSENNLYHQYYSIKQIINFCNKLRIKLILFCLLPGSWSLFNFLSKTPQYVNGINLKITKSLESNFVDNGNDGLHPGPLQHKIYHDQVLNHIKLHQLAFG